MILSKMPRTRVGHPRNLAVALMNTINYEPPQGEGQAKAKGNNKWMGKDEHKGKGTGHKAGKVIHREEGKGMSNKHKYNDSKL